MPSEQHTTSGRPSASGEQQQPAEATPKELVVPSIGELRGAIPRHCFERKVSTSLLYLLGDLLLAACGVALSLWHLSSPLTVGRMAVLPLIIFLQGSSMCGLWVLAHECGHGGFSAHPLLNDVVGLVVHSALLVPYFSWKMSHGHHHRRTGHAQEDTVFRPKTVSEVRSDSSLRLNGSPIRNLLGITLTLLLGWPLHLLINSTGRLYPGVPRYRLSHFYPWSPIFSPRPDNRIAALVILSDFGVLCGAAAGAWVWATFGLTHFVCVWLAPMLVLNAWLVTITYLQHTDPTLVHYREPTWSFAKGAFSTIDRSHGALMDAVLHHISDTHIVHHLFAEIPHYHAVEATHALRKAFPALCHIDNTFTPIALWRSFSTCNAIADEGQILPYITVPLDD